METLAGIAFVVAIIIVLGSDEKRWNARPAIQLLGLGVVLLVIGAACPLFAVVEGERGWLIASGVCVILGVLLVFYGAIVAKYGVSD